MKHEFVDNVCNYHETSILCNDENFPTYPGPTSGEQINWTFLGERRIHFKVSQIFLVLFFSHELHIYSTLNSTINA